MTEKPIIMSAESVLAILAGRKTQTRRVVAPPPYAIIDGVPYVDNPVKVVDKSTGKLVWRFSDDDGRRLVKPVRCRYATGDRLWVKETWGKSLHSEGYDENGYEAMNDCPAYKADGVYRCGKPAHSGIPWMSPIYMPRWASRITLEVTGVRVERLQDINGDDAIAEGIHPFVTQGVNYQRKTMYAVPGVIGTYADGEHGTRICHSAVEAYSELWDSLNDKRYPWASDPWVWVVEFKKAGEA